MGRLTKKDKQGRWSLLDFPWHELHSGAVLSVRLAEALYGALCKLKDYEDTGMNPEDVRKLDDFEQSQVGKMLKKLNEEQRKNRWIPVEEQLPKERNLYLVTAESAGTHYRLIAHWNAPGWTEETGQQKIIAWRPLPEPYQAERSDNNDGE